MGHGQRQGRLVWDSKDGSGEELSHMTQAGCRVIDRVQAAG